MNTIEISKQREQDAILFLLNKIKPIFEMPNVTDIWVDDGVVSFKEFGKKRTETDIFLNEQECINIIKNKRLRLIKKLILVFLLLTNSFPSNIYSYIYIFFC